MNPKRLVLLAAVLALGIVLGALLVGPAGVALGQGTLRQVSVAYPPSPCGMAVQSRLVTAEDGTAIYGLLLPPSPCGVLNPEIVAVPENTAYCSQSRNNDGARLLYCALSADNVNTTVSIIPSAIDQ
jgi:hypothetical protein